MRALIRILTATLVGALPVLGLSVLGLSVQGLQAQGRVVTKQERATRAFEQLTERMQKLKVTLQTTDPEKAKVLGLGSRFIQERALTAKMKDIEGLLQAESWDDAIDSCKTVIKDLNTLIDLLLKGDTRIEDILKEIERLEKFKQRVEDLIKDQRAEKMDSARAEALKEQLKKLEKAKKDLENLIQDQKDLRDEANNSGLSAEPKKAEDMAKQEGNLKGRAEKLADDLEDIAKESKELKDGAGPGDSKEPGDGKPGDGKPGEGEGSGSGGTESPPMPASSGAAKGAAQDMGAAQNKLSDNHPESSIEDMDKAIKKLEKAIKEIEEEIEKMKRELLKLPFEELAKKQEATKVDTDRLAEDMEKSEDDPGAGQGQPTPGKQPVQQAVPKQKSAAGSLKEYKPSKAKQDQQDAEDKLEEAKKALEDALAQLRQQLQDEVLRSLEERFGAMLEKQKKISAKTRLIDMQKKEALTVNGGVSSALASRTAKQADGEFELAGEAHASLKLLEEDGTTAVFPDFVAELRDDLKKVGRRLQKHKTGKASQAMQKEIEEMLKMLIDSLRQQIEQGNGGQP